MSEKSVREDNHDHPPRERSKENQLQGTSPQKVDYKNTTEHREGRTHLIADVGYDRTIVRYRNKWKQIISNYKQWREWEEGMDYDLYEEEYDHNRRVVGPSKRDHSHVGPDEED